MARCMQSLRDISEMLRQDTPETGYMVKQRLGEWKVLPKRLVPLFLAYCKDPRTATLLA